MMEPTELAITDEIQLYLQEGRRKAMEIASLVYLLLWRFNPTVKIEVGYDELLPEFYISVTRDKMEIEKAVEAYPLHHPETALANYRAGREIWDTNGDVW